MTCKAAKQAVGETDPTYLAMVIGAERSGRLTEAEGIKLLVEAMPARSKFVT
jgi:hypothetical protein